MDNLGSPSAQEQRGPASLPGPYSWPCNAPWQAITADTLLSRAPLRIWGLIVNAAAGGATVVSFWDGFNASAARRFRLAALAGGSAVALFPIPLSFQVGLFVDVDANTLEVLVLYEPLPEP